MAMLAFFLRTAVHNLRRGGQRVLVALLCITFGVLSLVAMTLLSEALEHMLVVEPQYLFGADITADRIDEEFILPEHIQDLENLQQSGVIDRISLAAYTSSITFRRPGSGELFFPSAGIGIDPHAYPPIGQLTIGQPGNVGLATLLQKPGDVVVTRDLALEYEIQPGNHLILSDLQVGAPLTATVQGILSDTPNHQGSKIYYNHATAEMLAGGTHWLNTALLTSAEPTAAYQALQSTGWRSFLATDVYENDKSAMGVFELFLNGAGLLGLLVGGIGIANTMQVLLQRRRKEVAIWKTLGYRSGELQVLFAVEAALLGLAGSLAGAVLGLVLSFLLVDLFSRTTTLLISWVFSPVPVLIGILVGVVMTITFAMFAIVTTSQVRPLAILRSEALTARVPWRQVLSILVLLSIPLTAATSLVMGSLLEGVAVLLVVFAGLIGLGGFLGGLGWLVIRLLPLGRLPLANMARNNLRRRGSSLVFAMVALFIGVVSLSMSTVVAQNAERVMDERALKVEGPNLTILAPAAQEPAIRQALDEQAGLPYNHGYNTTVRSIVVPAIPDAKITPVLVGRGEPGEFEVLRGAPWGSRPDGVYTFHFADVPVGSKVEVTLWDGSTHQLRVVGNYTVNELGYHPGLTLGLLLPNELSLQTATPESVQFYAIAPTGQVGELAAGIGSALPQATVINLLAYAARFTRSYQNFFVFSLAMAELALLAGILLVANSVSLAMLDRRYEMGVLKSIGYSRWHLLTTLVVEYGLVAAIATTAGLAAVKLFLLILGAVNNLAGSLLVMTWPSAVLIGLASLGLTLATVLFTTWGPSQVSPVIVLNDRQ